MGLLGQVKLWTKIKTFFLSSFCPIQPKVFEIWELNTLLLTKKNNNNEVILFGVENGKKLKYILEKFRTLQG